MQLQARKRRGRGKAGAARWASADYTSTNHEGGEGTRLRVHGRSRKRNVELCIQNRRGRGWFTILWPLGADASMRKTRSHRLPLRDDEAWKGLKTCTRHSFPVLQIASGAQMGSVKRGSARVCLDRLTPSQSSPISFDFLSAAQTFAAPSSVVTM